MAKLQRISPCLWFENQAEEAARYYTGIFRNSSIRKMTHYSTAGQEVHHRPPGSVMTVLFELDGHPFTALNGGPEFKFNEAVSFEIHCKDQEEIDYYWERLGAGGDPKAQVCGWLKDKFGLSWQVVPAVVPEMLQDEKSDKAQRVFGAIMQMKKIDIAALQKAFAG